MILKISLFFVVLAILINYSVEIKQESIYLN